MAPTRWGAGRAGLTPTYSEGFLEANIRLAFSARIYFGAMVVGTISECFGKQNHAVSPTLGAIFIHELPEGTGAKTGGVQGKEAGDSSADIRRRRGEKDQEREASLVGPITSHWN